MPKFITIRFEVENLTDEQLHQLLCVIIHEQGGPTSEMEAQKDEVLDIQMVREGDE